MNILDKIIVHKKKEVAERKALFPVPLLERSIYFDAPVVSLTNYLKREDGSGIIAEFKRRSPSKGVINGYADVERTTIGYMQAGASALSILTDEHFFGGKDQDLTIARKFNYCPILRKDFIIDEYQITEARSIGADAILLLANVLSPGRVLELSKFASELGLEILLEIREQRELSALNEFVSIVGVNNRDLKTFEVNVERSFELSSLIPSEFMKVSESGLDEPSTLIGLRSAGFQGFLIGERFMKNSRPEIACKQFIKQVNAQKIPEYETGI